jgi:hypothetical protein
MTGMTRKNTTAEALGDSGITDCPSLICGVLVAGPDNQDFQYWIERYGLSAQHIKLLMPISEAQRISEMVKAQREFAR